MGGKGAKRLRNAKFNFNSLVLVVIVFSAIFFFFTVKLVKFADNTAVNDYFAIEGCEYSVCYSNLRPNGIYVGDQNTGRLMLEGDYGHDWGAAVEGRVLYTNEYTATSFGQTLCRFVKIDLDTFQKEVVLTDAILRGRCASGELVCLGGFVMPTNHPKTNPLMGAYSLSSKIGRFRDNSAVVMFFDPVSGELVYSVTDENALAEDIDQIYLSRTLEEVMG